MLLATYVLITLYLVTCNLILLILNKDIMIQSKSNNWKEAFLAREWISIQTKRRVSPGFTATSTLLILHVSYC